MGIPKWGKIFGAAGRPVKSIWADVKGKRIAIDMNCLLYKHIKATACSAPLTNASGTPTSGLIAIIGLLPKLIKAGATKIIAVFDNPEPNPWKVAVCASRRQSAAKSAEAALVAETDEEKIRHEGNAWRMTAEVIADAQRCLSYLGVEWQVAAVGREAEQHAADLAKAGVVDIVLSDDVDALMFGAPIAIMARKTQVEGQSYKYLVFDLGKLLEQFGLSQDEFVHICIALGTDFAPKTPNVGLKSALTRGKNKPLSIEQEKMRDEFIRAPPQAPSAFAPAGPMDIPGLISWLVDYHNFGQERTQKALKGLMST